MSSRLIPPTRTTQPRRNTHCATCGRLLNHVYYFLADRPDCYCERCMTTRPKCSTCAAPVGDDGVQLHDGRTQCAACHRSAVYDPVMASTIYADVVQALRQHPGLQVTIGAAFRLIDAPAMRDLAQQAGMGDQHTLGMYVRQGRLRAVYALYGLPRLLFREVIAHEFAHVWQGEHCPLLHDFDWREGFAEWVAYRYLRHVGANKAAERLKNADHPYKVGLHMCLAIEEQSGVDAVLQAIRTIE